MDIFHVESIILNWLEEALLHDNTVLKFKNECKQFETDIHSKC